MKKYTCRRVVGLPDEDWHAVLVDDTEELCLCHLKDDALRIATAMNFYEMFQKSIEEAAAQKADTP